MAFLAGVDRVIIPEIPYDPEMLAFQVVQDKHQTPSNYAVVLVCDGSIIVEEKFDKYKDLQGEDQLGSGMLIARLLSHITGEETVYQPLTYLLRTGPPDGQDLLGAANFALTAARLLSEEKYGRMTAFTQKEMWTDVDLKLAGAGVKTVDIPTWYDAVDYKPELSMIWSAENGS
jgi:6-phosphofructokinase 1